MQKHIIPKRLSFDHLFQSRNLIFKALENSPEHTAFIRDMMVDDPETYAQSTNRLLAPLTVDDVEHDVSEMTKSLLAVIICLRPEHDTKKSDDGSEYHPRNSTDHCGLTAIGWLTLDCHTLTLHHRSCTLGIMIASAHQGQGHGTEAINWALDWGFRVAGMHAVRLSCFSFNERAVELYLSLGFMREGVTREAYYFDGIWYNSILFSMLDREWAAVRGISEK